VRSDDTLFPIRAFGDRTIRAARLALGIDTGVDICSPGGCAQERAEHDYQGRPRDAISPRLRMTRNLARVRAKSAP